MTRDPVYNQIIEALNRPLDAESFERAAVDLLRDDYALVPVRGGQDGGMDGAVGDGEGEAYPLITTTGVRLATNLKKNLLSYLATGRTRRIAVFATSREVNAKQRQVLERTAKELGFTLGQIHGRGDFADRVLRNTRWRKELLGITGDASALSFLPRSSRADLGVALVGRDDDVRWACDLEGDGLLLGQPGSGKTSVLRTIAKRQGGLFLVDPDLTKIANAVREQSPKVLLVDDAHLTPGLLQRLHHLRREISADFRILAASWPGERDMLAAELDLADGAVRELELLPRTEIVQIINAAGVGGPDELMHELVRQAEGRPGLAVTLARLCLNKGVWDVVMGRSLLQDLKTSLVPIVGREAVAILGILSVGGEAGMSLENVAEVLKMDLARTNDVVTRLALAGVVLQTEERRMAVRPAVLQFALVRESFFNGPSVLAIEPALAKTPDHDAATITLLGAAAREATVPWNLQIARLTSASSDEVWCLFASISAEHARYVLRVFPDQMEVIVKEALALIPEETLPLLLQKMIGDTRAPHSHPHSPKRIVQDWVKSKYPGSAHVPERRQQLLVAAERWLGQGRDYPVGLWAAFCALNPSYGSNRMSPSNTLSYILTFGFIAESQMRDLSGEWHRVLALIDPTRIDRWADFIECFWVWAHPMMGADKLPPSSLDFMRSFAAVMLRSVAALAVGRPGLVAWAHQNSEACDCTIEQPIDPGYAILFPEFDDTDYERGRRRQREAARALASDWSAEPPAEILRRVTALSREAASVQNSSSPQLAEFCEAIAQRSNRRSEWVRMLTAEEAGNIWVQPFLHLVAQEEEDGWEKLMEDCLGEPLARWSALDTLLCRPSLPEVLKGPLSAILPDHAESIRTCCLQRRVPVATLRWLLAHESEPVVAATVRGMWEAPSARGLVFNELLPVWREAFVRTIDGEHPAEDVLRHDPAIRFEWLAARIVRGAETFWRYDKAAAIASDSLITSERIALLKLLSDPYHILQAVASIVGRDPVAYGALLTLPHLKSSHLEPLTGEPDEPWAAMALVALAGGQNVDRVVRAVIGDSWGYSGDASVYWLTWKNKFTALLQNENPNVQKIAQAGMEWAESNRMQAAKSERRRAVHGH